MTTQQATDAVEYRATMTSSHAVALGRKIKKARQAQGLTQVQLAKRSGVSQASLSQIERGDVDMSVSALRKIAQALNADPGALLKEGRP